MPFKKLHINLQEKLALKKIVEPSIFQKRSIPVIKSGANVYCNAPKESGKTTTLILTTLQKLKCEPVGDAPRALILVENKEKAVELYEEFLTYIRYNSLRIFVSHDLIHIDILKSEILEGIDVLISTPTTMNKLLLCNGITTSQVKILSIDDAEFLIKKAAYTSLISITQSIKKSQYVLYSEKMHPMLKRFESSFMEYSKTVTA